jgi:REG-2-like HAD superfamily hydrolase
MPLRAVFLDVGHTLLREEPARSEIYASVARDHGFGLEARDMHELMRSAHAALPRELDGAFRYSDPWFRAYIRWIFQGRLGLAADEIEDVARELFDRFEHERTFRLFPGGPELLDELRERGLVLGAISNWSARLPFVLAATGLASRFDLVLCSAIERMEKPEPAIFRAALVRAGVRAEEAMHVGDHPEKDAAGARAVGIEPVLVDHAGTLRGDSLARCAGTTLVRDIPALRSIILSRLA